MPYDMWGVCFFVILFIRPRAELAALYEERFVGKLGHRRVREGVRIEAVDMRVGKFRIEAAHLLRIVAVLAVNKSGFLGHPCADESHAKLGAYRTEQEFGRGGNYDVVRPFLREIPRLKVAAVFIPEVAYDGVNIAKPRQKRDIFCFSFFAP